MGTLWQIMLRMLVVFSTIFGLFVSLRVIIRRIGITDVEISNATLEGLVKGAFPDATVILWDTRYWYTSLTAWGKILADVLMGMPKYTRDRYDCENFAMRATSRCDERWLLNTCGLAIGNAPGGYHGFNVFIASDNKGVHILEPQSGEVDPEGYRPDRIIFG